MTPATTLIENGIERVNCESRMRVEVEHLPDGDLTILAFQEFADGAAGLPPMAMSMRFSREEAAHLSKLLMTVGVN